MEWKIIIPPELLAAANQIIEKVKVEGLALSVDMQGTRLQARITQQPSGTNNVEIQITPIKFASGWPEKCPKCEELYTAAGGSFNGDQCGKCGWSRV